MVRGCATDVALQTATRSMPQNHAGYLRKVAAIWGAVISCFLEFPICTSSNLCFGSTNNTNTHTLPSHMHFLHQHPTWLLCSPGSTSNMHAPHIRHHILLTPLLLGRVLHQTPKHCSCSFFVPSLHSQPLTVTLSKGLSALLAGVHNLKHEAHAWFTSQTKQALGPALYHAMEEIHSCFRNCVEDLAKQGCLMWMSMGQFCHNSCR